MAKIRVGEKGYEPPKDPNSDPTTTSKPVSHNASEYPSLKATLQALAPEIFEGTEPVSAAKPKKKETGYRKEAPPTLFSNEDETTASSVAPRDSSGSRMSPHKLRAELSKPKVEQKYDPEEIDAMEYEAQDEIDEMLDEDEDVEGNAMHDYLFDLIADSAKDNMEAFVRANAASVHARGEDLWHERYRYDARMGHDNAELSESLRNEAADRAAAERSAELRRIAAEEAARSEAERRIASDDYARRLAEERNRR